MIPTGRGRDQVDVDVDEAGLDLVHDRRHLPELGAHERFHVCRQHGISEATLYNWRSRYGGMQVSDAKRLGSLEDENRKLKKLLAEAMLDNAALKDIASGKF